MPYADTAIYLKDYHLGGSSEWNGMDSVKSESRFQRPFKHLAVGGLHWWRFSPSTLTARRPWIAGAGSIHSISFGVAMVYKILQETVEMQHFISNLNKSKLNCRSKINNYHQSKIWKFGVLFGVNKKTKIGFGEFNLKLTKSKILFLIKLSTAYG